MKKRVFKIVLVVLLLFTFSCKNVVQLMMENPGQKKLNSDIRDSIFLDSEDLKLDNSLPIVQNVVASRGGSQSFVRLTWSAVDREKIAYHVFRSTDNKTFLKITSVPQTNNELQDVRRSDNVQEGVIYYYVVRAVAETGIGPAVTSVNGYLLSPPSIVTASYKEFEDKVLLTWSAGLGAKYYNIFRADYTTDGKTIIANSWKPIGQPVVGLEKNDFSVLNKGELLSGIKYAYKIVSCYDKVVVSSDSLVRTGSVLAPGASAPIQIIEVTKGAFKDRVRITWEASFDGGGNPLISYNVYRATSPSGEFVEPVGKKITNTYWYDTTVESGKTYYYKVAGINVEEDEGRLTIYTNEAYILKAKGKILDKPSFILPIKYLSVSKIEVNWGEVEYAEGYNIFRAGPFASIDEAELSIWKYMPDPGTWKDYKYEPAQPETLLPADIKIFSKNLRSFVDADPSIDATKIYFYKVQAVNITARDKYKNDVFDAGIGVEASSPTVTLPECDSTWISYVGQNDPKFEGKIPVKIKIPTKYEQYKNKLIVEVYRTYRYGGGHQGINTPRDNWIQNINLKNPDPAACPWEKEIKVGEILGKNMTGASSTIADTLFDTDNAGNKLVAVLDKMPGQDFDCVRDGNDSMGGRPAKNDTDGGQDGWPWYEKTEAVVNSDGQYERIKDPDGTNSEYEWHYLKWDWVFRKYMTHPGNPNKGNVNFVNAVSCGYRIALRWDTTLEGVTDRKESDPTKKISGYPSLTPREFFFLTEFVREVSMNKMGGLNYMSFTNSKDSGPMTNLGANVGKGAVGGTVGMSGGLTTLGPPIVIDGNVKTGPDFEEWKDVKMSFDVKINIIVKQVGMLNGNFNLNTPIYKGHVNFNCGLLSGLYTNWIHLGAIKVFDESKPEAGASVNYKAGNEWAGCIWNPLAAQERKNGNDNVYIDTKKPGRYTSVGWPINDTYPRYPDKTQF